MTQSISPIRWIVCVAVLLACAPLATTQEPNYTFRASSDLVQIIVDVRDRNGRFVRGLTRPDFELVEDGQQQQLTAIDVETVGEPPTTGARHALQKMPVDVPLLTSSETVLPGALKGVRLVVLFFDFTSLDVDDAARSLRAAEAYVNTLSEDDRVAIVSLAVKLEVQQDFTRDEFALRRSLQRLQGLSRLVVDSAQSDGPDGLLFHARGRLRSLRVLSTALAKVPQRKSVVFFAGKAASDSDNASITLTLAAALRANVSFYTTAAGGLAATPPLGGAATSGSFGTAVLSGTAVVNVTNSTDSQALLYALARGSGGRTFSNSNDLVRPFRAIESDTSEYYILNYRSSNARRDGRFRRISVRVHRRGLHLRYQAGYYGPRSEIAESSRDVDRILAEELVADLPASGLPVFGFAQYVRTDRESYYVPITILLSSRSLSYGGVAASATVVLAVVDSRGRLFRKLHDVIPASTVPQQFDRALQYDTATELPAGEYHVHLVVVQNGNGKVGSYSTLVRLPQDGRSPMVVSPLLSGTLAIASSTLPKSPLVVNGTRLVLNPLAEYKQQQRFTVQYQVECGLDTHACDASQIESSVQCFSGDQSVFKTVPPPSRVSGGIAVFRVEFPANSLPAGTYTCRVTAIHPQLRAFAFGATRLTVRIASGSSTSP